MAWIFGRVHNASTQSGNSFLSRVLLTFASYTESSVHVVVQHSAVFITIQPASNPASRKHVGSRIRWSECRYRVPVQRRRLRSIRFFLFCKTESRPGALVCQNGTKSCVRNLHKVLIRYRSEVNALLLTLVCPNNDRAAFLLFCLPNHFIGCLIHEGMNNQSFRI